MDALISNQFLSYEGTIDGIEGPANGLTSSDIGVEESGATLSTSSLGLTGSGTQYSDFTWTTFVNATPGSPNTTQALPVELSSFSAIQLNDGIKLNWTTATEIQNYGFDIERKSSNEIWKKIRFIAGYGNSCFNKSLFFY